MLAICQRIPGGLDVCFGMCEELLRCSGGILHLTAAIPRAGVSVSDDRLANRSRPLTPGYVVRPSDVERMSPMVAWHSIEHDPVTLLHLA